MTSAPKPAPSVRILLVDDNKHGLSARKGVLEQQGYSVVACRAGEEALDQFRSSKFDLVVTDYRMPEMNGAELIGHLRAIDTKIPVVLISGMVNVLGLDEINTGADVVIAKSATEVPHMVRAVARLLSRNAPRKPVKSQRSGGSQKRKTV